MKGRAVFIVGCKPQLSDSFTKGGLKAEWRGGVPGDVTRLCTVLWLLVRQQEASQESTSSALRLRRPGGYVLMVLRYLVSSLWWGFWHLWNNSGSAHQILLSLYFREELQQRRWGRGLSREGPTGSCLVTDVIWWHLLKLKTYVPFSPALSTSYSLPKENTSLHREASSRVFGTDLIVIETNWRHPKCWTKGGLFKNERTMASRCITNSVDQKRKADLYMLT